jgi:hypothetical protein
MFANELRLARAAALGLSTLISGDSVLACRFEGAMFSVPDALKVETVASDGEL